MVANKQNNEKVEQASQIQPIMCFNYLSSFSLSINKIQRLI